MNICGRQHLGEAHQRPATAHEPGRTCSEAQSRGAGLTLLCSRQSDPEARCACATAEPGRSLPVAQFRSAGLTNTVAVAVMMPTAPLRPYESGRRRGEAQSRGAGLTYAAATMWMISKEFVRPPEPGHPRLESQRTSAGLTLSNAVAISRVQPTSRLRPPEPGHLWREAQPTTAGLSYGRLSSLAAQFASATVMRRPLNVWNPLHICRRQSPAHAGVRTFDLVPGSPFSHREDSHEGINTGQ